MNLCANVHGRSNNPQRLEGHVWALFFQSVNINYQTSLSYVSMSRCSTTAGTTIWNYRINLCIAVSKWLSHYVVSWIMTFSKAANYQAEYVGLTGSYFCMPVHPWKYHM